MGLRYRKSIKIAPGVHLNVGSRSAGISVGTRGCRYSVNTRGRRTATVGGISYSSGKSGKKRSYQSKAYANRSAINQRQRELKQQEKIEEATKNQLIVEEFENYIEMIQNVHRECEDPIRWEDVLSAPAPFEKGVMGPRELEATDALKNFKPSLFGNLFSGNEKKREALAARIAKARQEDIDEYKAWEDSISFAEKILQGNLDAYYEVIVESNPFEDLVLFGSGFEFGTDDPGMLEVEFTVNPGQVVPKKTKKLLKSGKLSEKDFSKTAYYDIVQDYVCSCSIRLAREIFSILPVETVIVHATDLVLNTATGLDEMQTILSVKFNLDGFLRVNFDRIDASDFVETFEHKMVFKKTAGFKPVERIKNQPVPAKKTQPAGSGEERPVEYIYTKWGKRPKPNPYKIDLTRH